MKAPGNIGEFSERVNLYLDKALSEEDESRLLQEADENPNYRSVLNDEQSFRDFVKNNVHRSSVSPDLIRSIRAQIKTE